MQQGYDCLSVRRGIHIWTHFPIFWRERDWHQGLYSLSGKTSYRKISWSLEAARFGFKLFQSLWNLASTSAAALPRCLSNFRAILPLQHPISRLRDFTRFGGKTSYRLVNRDPEMIRPVVHKDGETIFCEIIWPTGDSRDLFSEVISTKLWSYISSRLDWKYNCPLW